MRQGLALQGARAACRFMSHVSVSTPYWPLDSARRRIDLGFRRRCRARRQARDAPAKSQTQGNLLGGGSCQVGCVAGGQLFSTCAHAVLARESGACARLVTLRRAFSRAHSCQTAVPAAGCAPIDRAAWAAEAAAVLVETGCVLGSFRASCRASRPPLRWRRGSPLAP